MSETLRDHVADHVHMGSAERHLGLQRMPEGFALLSDADNYFYWVREDGVSGERHWDKWAAFRDAKLNPAPPPHPTA